MDVNNYDKALIKQIINCILYPIKHIFNNSIVTGLFATDMKKSIIKPLFKIMTIKILLITAQLHFYHKLLIF